MSITALSFRRVGVLAGVVLAAVLVVAGIFLDPDIGASGRELAGEYAAAPGRTQVSALCFHFAFVMWAPVVFVLVGMVRGPGAWFANAAAVLAVLGATTLPGFLLTDFYDIAIAGELGLDAWTQVDDRIQELPGATVLFVTGFFGFAFCLPFATLGAWRAGLVPLWLPFAVLVGFFGGQAIPGPGGLLLLAAARARVRARADRRGRVGPTVGSPRVAADQTSVCRSAMRSVAQVCASSRRRSVSASRSSGESGTCSGATSIRTWWSDDSASGRMQRFRSIRLPSAGRP